MANAGRKLRGINAKRAIRAFERAGYRIARIQRSHYILEHEVRPAIQLPYHRALKQGLLLKMVRRAGLTVEEFEGSL